jgi:hypothetical protein
VKVVYVVDFYLQTWCIDFNVAKLVCFLIVS